MSLDLVKEIFGALPDCGEWQNSDSEVDPLSMKTQAYVFCGNMKDGDDEHQIKLISMNTPITTLKNRFLHDKGKFSGRFRTKC